MGKRPKPGEQLTFKFKGFINSSPRFFSMDSFYSRKEKERKKKEKK